MSNWVSYKNGNYTVHFNKDNGTKVRINDLDNLTPEFPESYDFKICNKCNMGCSFCHENSTPNGEIGDIMNLEFINTLHPYTEIAIGGGNPLEHPDLEAFLMKCKTLNLIPSMTVHQKHFMENLSFIRYLYDENLIYGLGISVNDVTSEFIDEVKKFPRAVLHVINGIIKYDDLYTLKDNNLKILILGYKIFRRGEKLYDDFYNEIESRKSMLYHTLDKIISEGWFNTVSFDNLAIKQLEPKRLMTEEEYDRFYMGDDGQYTMYVDGVKKEFAPNSCCTERYPIMDNIVDMFNKVREVSKNDNGETL